MPTNLPAEAKHKWSEVSAARTPEEKLRALQEFLSLIPKHKGTAKLCAHVKRQISILRREIEEKRKRRGGRSSQTFLIEKEGAAQIVIVGLTNSGRSSLLSSLTNAKVTVSEAPYTTQTPTPGMFRFEDVYFQLIEAPAFTTEYVNEKMLNLTLNLCRNADMLALMIDLSMDPLWQMQHITSELEKGRINIFKRDVRVEIERKHFGSGLRIVVFGRLNGCSVEDVKDLLMSYRIHDGVVKIYGEASLDDVEEAVFGGFIYKPAVIIANKMDVEGAERNLSLLKEHLEGIRIIPISCRRGIDRKVLGRGLLEASGLIRVYTKEPGEKEPSPEPFILKRGSTVLDLARRIHSEFYERFSCAKVWAERLPFSPQKVGSSFILEDGDVVELHTR